jgi:hypothetical protein
VNSILRPRKDTKNHEGRIARSRVTAVDFGAEFPRISLCPFVGNLPWVLRKSSQEITEATEGEPFAWLTPLAPFPPVQKVWPPGDLEVLLLNLLTPFLPQRRPDDFSHNLVGRPPQKRTQIELPSLISVTSYVNGQAHKTPKAISTEGNGGHGDRSLVQERARKTDRLFTSLRLSKPNSLSIFFVPFSVLSWATCLELAQFRRRAIQPTTPAPLSIKAQVEGSGTAVKFERTTVFTPNGLAAP